MPCRVATSSDSVRHSSAWPRSPGYEFDKVWVWDDWPGKDKRGDTGIDLVARETGSGDLVAIECKFYAPAATLAWPQVSTFVGMLGQPGVRFRDDRLDCGWRVQERPLQHRAPREARAHLARR